MPPILGWVRSYQRAWLRPDLIAGIVVWSVVTLVRDPRGGVWENARRHPNWERPADRLVVRVAGPLFYANSLYVKQRLLDLVAASTPCPMLVLDLGHSDDIDVQSIDSLGELAAELSDAGTQLALGNMHAQTEKMLRRAGLLSQIRISRTLDFYVASVSEDGPVTQTG